MVGGGPAGCLSALLLARAGWTVELLEQSRFPRDKVCGECLSGLGRAVLGRAGLADRVAAAGAVELVRTLIHPGEGPAIELQLPVMMWGISRFALDGLLLGVASEAGVVIRQPVRCEGVQGGPRPTVAWRDLRTNEVGRTSADRVVVADGKSALLPPTPAATGDIGIKTHFIGVAGPRDAIELFAGPGAYGGLAAVEGDRWNAAFSLPAAMIRRHGGDLDAAFAEVVGWNPTLAVRLRAATQSRPWLAAPLPRFAARQSWPAGVVPVGNAAAALEPIGGEGMGLALRSAEQAVADIVSNVDSKRTATFYRRLWEQRQIACRLVATVSASSRWSPMASELLHDQSHLSQLAMRWMGKTS